MYIFLFAILITFSLPSYKFLISTSFIPCLVYVKTRFKMNYTHSGETSTSSGNFLPGKHIPLSDLGALGAGTDVEATSRETGASTAPNYTQAGVKNIEAVSMSWTKWGLISAYARFVERAMERGSQD
jgi:hypothetical protein